MGTSHAHEHRALAIKKVSGLITLHVSMYVHIDTYMCVSIAFSCVSIFTFICFGINKYSHMYGCTQVDNWIDIYMVFTYKCCNVYEKHFWRICVGSPREFV